MEKRMKNIMILAICVFSILLIGFLSSFANINSIPTWYASLEKPSFNPPNWIFGPVWTILYIMMGVSLFLFITNKGKEQDKKFGYWMFGIQLFLNFIWSIVFFGMHRIAFGFLVIILLWFFIVLTMIMFYKISKASAYLMIPYLIWVTFAAVLNFSIGMLNVSMGILNK
jgi:benzodiazapine receptor